MEGGLWNDAREVWAFGYDYLKLFSHIIFQALAEVADLAAKYSSDGVDVHFLNNTQSALDVKVDKFNICLPLALTFTLPCT